MHALQCCLYSKTSVKDGREIERVRARFVEERNWRKKLLADSEANQIFDKKKGLRIH